MTRVCHSLKHNVSSLSSATLRAKVWTWKRSCYLQVETCLCRSLCFGSVFSHCLEQPPSAFSQSVCVAVIIDLKFFGCWVAGRATTSQATRVGINQFQVHQPFAREQWFPNSLQPWEHPSGIKHAWHRAPRNLSIWIKTAQQWPGRQLAILPLDRRSHLLLERNEDRNFKLFALSSPVTPVLCRLPRGG